ncbi:MAG: flagellar hook-associated protein FlgK [Betaproteobacteria bacterium]|nr:flagellar hook-associated protein FlgK [Betaproteobacteria bacterium]
MGTGILGIAASGLNAAQAAIRVTQQNIANVGTDGYRRQELVQSARQPQFSGYGYIGNGVSVDAVRHQYSRFLDSEVLHSESQYARYEAASARSALIDKLLGDDATGLNSVLSGFYSALQEVANDPASSATRQNLLSAGENLAGRFNLLAGQLREQRTAANNEAQHLATRINVLAGQIAQANVTITQNRSASGQAANDLVDARDQLVVELSRLIDVTRQDLPDGSVNVFIGGGQSLVLGQDVRRLNLVANANDPALLDPAINMGFERYGSLIADPAARVVTSGASSLSGRISGGELGGLLEFRDATLMPALRDLDRMALALASAVNTVHRGGLDYALNPGVDFFVNPVVPQGATAGALHLTVTDDSLLDPVGYSISLAGGVYTVTELSTGTATNHASLAAVNAAGFGFSLTAGVPAPANGESWRIGDSARTLAMAIGNTSQIAAAAAAATGPGDNGNALALAALQSTALLNFGGVAFSDTLSAAYNKIVNRTASQASQHDLNRDAFETLRQSAVSAQQSLVGVNLDEEAVNLVRYQQAYQAAARTMQIAASLFDELLNVVR